MRRSWRTIPRVYFQWASVVDGGMTLELVEADESGSVTEGGLNPVATIVADGDETHWLEIYPEEGAVRIPLSELIRAIELAKDGVHGEGYYDRRDEGYLHPSGENQMTERGARSPGTPLAKKLGIVAKSRVVAVHAPSHYTEWLEPLPDEVLFEQTVSSSTDLVHVFCDRKTDLQAQLDDLRGRIRSNGVVWVSWPKRSSKVPTDITEDTIRELALPLGFVDVKVCAIDPVWSGLKLVIRKALR